MKTKYKITALLTALLLIPIFTVHAEESPAFTIDQRRVLQGMNRSWLQGYEPKISRNVLWKKEPSWILCRSPNVVPTPSTKVFSTATRS